MNPTNPSQQSANLIQIQANFLQATYTQNFPQTQDLSYEQTQTFYTQPDYYLQPSNTSASYLPVSTSYAQTTNYSTPVQPPLPPEPYQQPNYSATPPVYKETVSNSTKPNLKAIQCGPQSIPQKKAPVSNKASAPPRDRKRIILDDIKQGRDFEAQIKILESKFTSMQETASEDAKKKQKLIKRDIEMALYLKRPFAKAHFVQSNLTEFNFADNQRQYIYIANVRRNDETEIVTLNQIKTLIETKLFDYVLLLTSTPFPVIRCLHKETKLWCQINISNKISIDNRELLDFYIGLDPKFKTLTILINFWAECYDLKSAISTHALCLLIIFYLQQEPYNLPSVYDLQNKSNNKKSSDSWNRNFAPIEDFQVSHLENITILELFTGFLKFYSNFDYINEVVCVYYAKSIRKIDFLNPHTLPECFSLYKKLTSDDSSLLMDLNASLCIQDPFEHSRNVTKCVSLNSIGALIAFCKGGSNFYIDDESDLLSKYLKYCRDQATTTRFSFELKKSRELDCSNKQWFDGVKELLLKTIKGVLNCRLKLITDLSSLKDNYPDFNDDQTVDNAIFLCRGNINLWENRIQVTQKILRSSNCALNDIDLEVEVTNKIAAEARKDDDYEDNNTPVELCIAIFLKKNPFRVKIIMKALENCHEFAHISHFIQVKLNKWLTFVEEDVKPKNVPVEAMPKAIIIKEENVIDEDIGGSPIEEDVPEDFFDDFSNQQFLEVLEELNGDILNTSLTEGGIDDKSVESETINNKNSRDSSPIIFVKESEVRVKKSPIRFPSVTPLERPLIKPFFIKHKSPTPIVRVRPLSVESVFNETTKQIRTRESSIDFESKIKRWRDNVNNESLKRRDPDKTRRDIIKDKEKSLQSKTEVNIYIKSSVQKVPVQQNSPSSSNKKSSRSRHTSSSSPIKKIEKSRCIPRSFVKKYSKSPSPVKRRRYSRSRSPLKRNTTTIKRTYRSPLRLPNRKPYKKRSASLSPVHYTKKRSRSRTPIKRKRSRTRSPRRKYYKSRSSSRSSSSYRPRVSRRDKSRSPIYSSTSSKKRSSRSRSRSKELKRCKSLLLEEVKQQINSTALRIPLIPIKPTFQVSDEDLEKTITQLDPKTKIVENCNNIVEYLSKNEMVSKTTGHLIVRHSNREERKKSGSIPVVRFGFTTNNTNQPNEKTDQYALALNKVLQDTNVAKDSVNLNSEELERELSKVVKTFADNSVQCGTPTANLNSIGIQVDEEELKMNEIKIECIDVSSDMEIDDDDDGNLPSDPSIRVKTEKCEEGESEVVQVVAEACSKDQEEVKANEPQVEKKIKDGSAKNVEKSAIETNKKVQPEKSQEDKVKETEEVKANEPQVEKKIEDGSAKNVEKSAIETNKKIQPDKSQEDKVKETAAKTNIKIQEEKAKTTKIEKPQDQKAKSSSSKEIKSSFRDTRIYNSKFKEPYYKKNRYDSSHYHQDLELYGDLVVSDAVYDYDDNECHREDIRDLRDVIIGPVPRMYESWRPPRSYHSPDVFRGHIRGSGYRGSSFRGYSRRPRRGFF